MQTNSGKLIRNSKNLKPPTKEICNWSKSKTNFSKTTNVPYLSYSEEMLFAELARRDMKKKE